MTLFFPREHGATVQLGAALVGALLLGSPGAASVALTLAAVAAFWAHEPLSVALGRRGERLREAHGPAARRVAVGLGLATVALLGAAALILPGEALVSLHPPLVVGAFLHIAFAARRERTIGGEMLAGVALSAWAVPVAVAGGVGPATGMQAWLAFSVGFVVAALAVKAVIQSARPKQAAALRVAAMFAAIAAVAVLLGLGMAERLSAAVGWAVVPPALFAVFLSSATPHPRNLKKIGWGLTAASAFCVVSLVVGLR